MYRCINVLIMLIIATYPANAEKNTAVVRLSINTFTSVDIDAALIEKLTSVLYRELVVLRGDEYVLYRKKGGLDKSANRQLAGSVEKIDSVYYITVKVLDGERGEHLFNRTCTADRDNLEKTLKRIAKDIHRVNRIWKR